MFSKIAVFAALAATVAAKDARTFAVNHFYGKGPLVTGRLDPIVSPGVASGHEHVIQGGNKMALSLTATELTTSTCTSSLIKADNSAYWTPTVYFQDPKTGLYEPVEMYYMNVYYFFEATDDVIKAFPTGLRMVIGNPSLRTPPYTADSINVLDSGHPTGQPVQFTCPRSSYNPPSYPANSDGLHGCGIGDTNNKGAGAGFPDYNCDGLYSPLRADVHFPSCYNPAVALDDYKNNMAFPTNVNGKQNCPAGWIHVPHLFYEVYWNTQPFASRWTPGQCNQPFVLSNGDKTGYSLHGDFFAGWNEPVLQNIIDTCNAGDAGMENCAGLALNDRSTSCNIPNPLGEVSTVGMSKLPGGLTTTGFGAAAAPPPAAPASSSSTAPAKPATSSSAAAPPAASTTKPATSAAAPPVIKVPTTTSTVPTTMATVPAAPPKASSTTKPADPPASTSAASAVVAAASSTPAVPACGSKTPTLPGGWKSIGCWTDHLNPRVLTGIQFLAIGNHQVTATACMEGCAKAGFTLAGVEWGSQCFCGNMLSNSQVTDPSECNMPCEGDKTQICGGSLTLNVYSLTSSVRRRHLKRHIDGHKA